MLISSSYIEYIYLCVCSVYLILNAENQSNISKTYFYELKNNHWYNLKLNIHLLNNRKKKRKHDLYGKKKYGRDYCSLLLSDYNTITETLRSQIICIQGKATWINMVDTYYFTERWQSVVAKSL